VIYFKALPHLKMEMKKLVDVLIEIRAGHAPNTRQKLYGLRQLSRSRLLNVCDFGDE
jgi:hypothetical protein